MKRRKKYDKITQTVNELIGIISHSDTVQEVFYNTGLAAGYLYGLVLAGTIMPEDERTYMHTVREFARQAERRLQGDGDKGNIPGDRRPDHSAVLHRGMSCVQIQRVADIGEGLLFAVREPGRLYM